MTHSTLHHFPALVASGMIVMQHRRCAGRLRIYTDAQRLERQRAACARYNRKRRAA